MIDKIVPLDIPPGFVSDGGRSKAGSVRWRSGNLVRFEDNAVVPIGGWTFMTDTTLTAFPALSGKPRAMVAFASDNGTYPALVIGTTTTLYSVINGSLYNLTPASFVGIPGDGLWQDGSTTGLKPSQQLTECGVWTLDHMNNRIVACATNGKLYVQNGTAFDVPVDVQTLGDAAAPNALSTVVTPENFLFALAGWGTLNPQATSGQTVMWASQGSWTTWTPAVGNTAGSIQLATAGRIYAGRATRSQTLIWTDVDLHVATYIGGDLVYRFDRVAEKCGLFGRNAVAMVGDSAFWLSRNGFYTYDGVVRKLECPVFDRVNDIMELRYPQRNKVWGVSNVKFNEVTWYLPNTMNECDFYVTYNYVTGAWTYGDLARGAGVDAGVWHAPILCGSDDQKLYIHEVGKITSETPYAETTMLYPSIDDVMTLTRVMLDGEELAGLDLTVYRTFEYGDNESANLELVQSPIDFTVSGRQDMRHKGRGFAFIFAFNGSGSHTDWKLGRVHVGLVPGSRR